MGKGLTISLGGVTLTLVGWLILLAATVMRALDGTYDTLFYWLAGATILQFVGFGIAAVGYLWNQSS